jgi:hypothetical protein
LDAERFDALARDVSTPGTRRALLRLVAALPLAGLLSGFLGRATSQADGSGAVVGGGGRRRHRRKRHHRHQRHQRHQRQDCPQSCGPCQSCQQGKCQPDSDGSSCGGGTCCNGTCIDTDTDPLNCGRCGAHCPIFGVCQQGKCVCPKCPNSLYPFQCCAPDTDGCSICGDYDSDILGDPFTCQTNIARADCPPERVCRGTDALCDTCCPAGTTCDTEFGRCLR